MSKFLPIPREVIVDFASQFFSKKLGAHAHPSVHFPVSLEHAKSVKNFLPSNKSFFISSTEDKKNFYIKKSILCVAKSGTISLDICKNKSPLITIFKTSWFNYFLIKPFVKVKFANIVNIIANKELIPELIQSDCNVSSIFKKVSLFIENKKVRTLNVSNYQKIIKKITKNNSSKLIAQTVKSYL
jgi:lipid-A-disaccharide synthase